MALAILASILGIIAGILLMDPSTMVIVAFAILAGAFTIAAWVISLVALNKVRRIRQSDFVGDLGVKVWLARIVAFIGIAICVITILGGLLLGILWLLRLI